MSDTAALQAAWQDAAEEVAGIGFWRMDPSTGAVDWTPNMFRLFEFPVGPAPNAQETMSRIHPDDRADAYIDLSSNLQAGGHVSISRIMLPSGGIRVVESRTIVQRDAAGEVASIIGSVLDITTRVERERDIAHARATAENEIWQKQSYAADLSHELRTPLMAILGYAHLLAARDDIPAAARSDLEHLTRSSDALLSVANNVLGRSKAAAALAANKVAPVAINTLVGNVLDIFSQQARLNGVALRQEISDGFPPFLEAHADALIQILINLIGNAIKFTDRGSITVSTDHDENLEILSIAVKDTGHGFDDATRAVLFDRFSQGIGPQILPAGAGLGLSFCKGLVEALQGTIEVQSAPEAGACFTVRIHAPRSLAPDTGQFDNGTVSSVLIVDDHPANREICTRILQGAGAFVVAAENAASGLDAAAFQQFDLILLDLNLPDISGAEVASTIRDGNGPNALTRICAFTAADIDQGSLPPTFNDLLAKPLDPLALIEMARKPASSSKPSDEIIR